MIDLDNNYNNNIFRNSPKFMLVEEMIKHPMPPTPIPLYMLPDGEPTKPAVQPVCNCLYGTPVITKEGFCGCDNGTITVRGIDQMPRNPVRKPRQFDVNAKRPYGVNGRKVRNFTTDEIRCRSRQAPSGYHYGIYNGVCMLMTADNKPVQTVVASQADVSANTVQGGLGLIGNIQAMVSNNPLLTLAAVGGAIYLATKK